MYLSQFQKRLQLSSLLWSSLIFTNLALTIIKEEHCIIFESKPVYLLTFIQLYLFFCYLYMYMFGFVYLVFVEFYNCDNISEWAQSIIVIISFTGKINVILFDRVYYLYTIKIVMQSYGKVREQDVVMQQDCLLQMRLDLWKHCPIFLPSMYSNIIFPVHSRLFR